MTSGEPRDFVADSDFRSRCGTQGVIKCVGFDSVSDIVGTFGDNSGILRGSAGAPVLDTIVKASGNSSLKFTIPANSVGGDAGSYFANFSNDLLAQFESGQEFYVQWRQRFSPEFIKPGAGWKQAIIGTGDQPGHLHSSCTDLEVVLQNSYQRGFAQMYNSCNGSTSHGAYDPFQQPFGNSDFKLQNARPSPYCLYSQGQATPVRFYPPKGNCFGYFANEWMTFLVHIKLGARVKDEFTNSLVQLWIARERQPSELVINWGPYNLSAGSPTENLKYGKIWLLPYSGSSVFANTSYTWYDELIISTRPVPDPK